MSFKFIYKPLCKGQLNISFLKNRSFLRMIFFKYFHSFEIIATKTGFLIISGLFSWRSSRQANADEVLTARAQALESRLVSP